MFNILPFFFKDIYIPIPSTYSVKIKNKICYNLVTIEIVVTRVCVCVCVCVCIYIY